MNATSTETCDVLIVGGGPAGLTAAAALAGKVAGRVLVLDREARAGGIPRHSGHLGYGIRDLHRFISGPAYARRLVTAAQRAGAEIRTRAMVTGWAAERTVQITSPQGRYELAARVIILATGARERPRPARLIPGDRPAGVYTTGQLQNLVHLHHAPVGHRALIVGAELVSFSAAMTLREAGCEVVGMTSVHPQAEAFAAFRLGARLAYGLRVHTRTRVVRVLGRGRVSAVELEHVDNGRRNSVACDTVIFTGDWIPDHELARSGGVELDRGTRGPLVDTRQATQRPGVFAIGNLVHPVDTADVAALDGRSVARHVIAHLDDNDDPRRPTTRITPGDSLRWITPGLLDAGGRPPRNVFLAWPQRQILAPSVTVTQAGRQLARRHLPWTASPGRVLRLPASLLETVTLGGQDVVISIG